MRQTLKKKGESVIQVKIRVGLAMTLGVRCQAGRDLVSTSKGEGTHKKNLGISGKWRQMLGPGFGSAPEKCYQDSRI